MLALVLGLGISGKSAAKFLQTRGWKVSAYDRDVNMLSVNEEVKKLQSKGLHIYNKIEEVNVNLYELVVVSPGFPQSHPLYVQAVQQEVEVIGEIELACRYLKQPCAGITGTNGKTTTTLMAEHVLNACGIQARALGNVGTPLTSAIGELSESTVAIIELSSWQLDTLATRVLDIAVITNITPNHLDRYAGMDHYAMSKLHIADCLKSDGVLYIQDTAWENYRGLAEGLHPRLFGYSTKADLRCNKTAVYIKEKVEFFLPIVYRNMISHHVENILGCYSICRHYGVQGDDFLQALESFKPQPHRIEFVKTKAGVAYYNDSKGTSLDAVKQAVGSLNGGIILIAGGTHKGAPYSTWGSFFKGKVRHVCAIGQAAPIIQEELSHFVPVSFFPSLDAAVLFASSIAVKGENVLLSPGCSSFDMFIDYKHRGEEFKRIVSQL